MCGGGVNSPTPKRTALRCYTRGRNSIGRVLGHQCCSGRKYYAELGSECRDATVTPTGPFRARGVRGGVVDQ